MIIDRIVMKAGVLSGRLVYRGFEHFTSNAAETQKKLLQKLMKDNAETEYGKKYDFAHITTPEEYREKVPYSNYATYADDVQRMIKGDKNVLTAYKVDQYVETSGSSGTPKVVPMSNKSAWNVYCMGFLGPVACVDKFYRAHGKRMATTKGFLPWVVAQRHLPNGERILDGCSVPISSLKPIVDLYSATPKPLVFFDDPQKLDGNYLFLRFGLPFKNVSFIGAIMIASSVSMFQYLERNWQTLCDDIEAGVINDSVILPAELRKKLEKKLRPAPRRAAELRKEFEKGFDDPIAPRIWPKFSWIYGMAGGTLAAYAERIRRYIGTVPLHNFGYGASEGYFAMPLTPDAEDAVILPKSNYFEFIPRDPEEGDTPKTITEVKVGNEYEVVLTNLSGFYRYRLDDVVKITGFYNNSPKVKFLYRANIMLNLSDEKTTQSMLDASMAETAEKLGINYMSYSTYGDTEADIPHYTVLIETAQEVDEALREAAGKAFDEAVRKNNIEYNRYRRNATLGDVEVHFISAGTFDEYKEMLHEKGRNTNQIKPVTIINTPAKKEFFFSHITL